MFGMKWEKFKLDHHDLDRFHRSEWDDPGVPSVWYVCYRLLLAAVMVTGVISHALLSSAGVKWLIYMTDQGISVLALNYTLHALLVLYNRISPRTSNGRTLPLLYKCSWALESMSSGLALFITLIYWSLLHPMVVHYHILKTPLDVFLNFFLHGLNTVSYIVDILVTGRPFRIHHFFLPIIFGLWYAIFSVVYWASGGTGRCSVRCINITDTVIKPGTVTRAGMCSTPECNISVCDDFIYPIMDWSCTPGYSLLLIAMGMLGMPLIQTFWWILYKLRMKTSEKFGSARLRQKTIFSPAEELTKM